MIPLIQGTGNLGQGLSDATRPITHGHGIVSVRRDKVYDFGFAGQFKHIVVGIRMNGKGLLGWSTFSLACGQLLSRI